MKLYPRNILLYVLLLIIGYSASTTIEKLASREAVTFDLLARIEFIVGHPVEKVWPHILNREPWIKAFPLETISGVRGQEGERFKISILTNGNFFGEVFAETVRVIPNRQFIMKYLPFESPLGVIETIQGYDAYDLEDVNGKTRVTFQTFQEYGTTQMSEASFRKHGRKTLAEVEKKWHEEYIPNLKILLQQKDNVEDL